MHLLAGERFCDSGRNGKRFGVNKVQTAGQVLGGKECQVVFRGLVELQLEVGA